MALGSHRWIRAGRRHRFAREREHALEIGDGRAEQLKIQIGSAAKFAGEETEVTGRDLHSGGIRTATVTASEVHEALEATVGQIIEAVRETLEETPPELSADIGERGIVLAGGGALLHGFAQRLRAETGLPVELAEEPLTCVAGCGSPRSTNSERSLRQRKPRGAANTVKRAGFLLLRR